MGRRGSARSGTEERIMAWRAGGSTGPGPSSSGATGYVFPRRLGKQVREATGIEAFHRVPAKHFLQEDQAPAIAERIARLGDK
jgi:hypothetical protein